jgi:hypothetical protein
LIRANVFLTRGSNIAIRERLDHWQYEPMAGVCRLGDKSKALIDVHCCPACPHPEVTGPSITASHDVFMLLAFRVFRIVVISNRERRIDPEIGEDTQPAKRSSPPRWSYRSRC